MPDSFVRWGRGGEAGRQAGRERGREGEGGYDWFHWSRKGGWKALKLQDRTGHEREREREREEKWKGVRDRGDKRYELREGVACCYSVNGLWLFPCLPTMHVQHVLTHTHTHTLSLSLSLSLSGGDAMATLASQISFPPKPHPLTPRPHPHK